MGEIGLFPLELVLLPGERVPLHIFEDRYRELIGECLAEDGRFGLILENEDGLRQVGTDTAHDLHLQRNAVLGDQDSEEHVAPHAGVPAPAH